MAFAFNGTSAYLETLSTPVDACPMTLFCWTRNAGSTSAGTQNCISVGDRNAEDRNMIFVFNGTTGDDAADAFSARTDSTNARSRITLSPSITTLTWKPFAGVFASNSSRTSYYDGTVGTTNTTTINTVNIDSIMIGARYNTAVGGFFFGQLAECAIWNVELSLPEIKSLEAGIIPLKIRPANLKFYAPLLDDPIDIIGGRTLSIIDAFPSEFHPPVFR